MNIILLAVVVAICCGLLVYAVDLLPGIQQPFRNIAKVLIIVGFVAWLLSSVV